MRILSVDYGDRRVGLAISDELGIAAHGLDTADVTSPRRAANHIVAVAQERNAEIIVVGMPYNMDGTKGDRATKTDEFCVMLRNRTNIPVETFDERLTTSRAESTLHEAGLDERKSRGKKDRIAAVLILQDYLEFRRIRGESTMETE
jgi:putative holliday junction resolvase